MQNDGADKKKARNSIWPGSLGIAQSYLAGGVVLALTNALGILLSASFPGLLVRLQHHFFDAIETIGLCLLCGGVALVARRVAWGSERLKTVVGISVYTLVAAALLTLLLGNTIERDAVVVADILGGKVPGPALSFAHGSLIALVAIGIPVLHIVGHVLSRWRAGFVIALGLGLGIEFLNYCLLLDAYEDVHTALSLAGVCLTGSALATRGSWLLGKWRDRVTKRTRTVAFGLGILLMAVALMVAPPNRIRFELFKVPSAAAEYVLAQVVWRIPTASGTSEILERKVEAARRSVDAPQHERIEAPVVVLLTLDAVREDVIARNEKRRPTLSGIRDAGAHFENAFAPGSQTVVSLTSLFSGRYYSQLYWSPYGKGESRRYYPAEDRSPRLAELLDAAKVETVSALSPWFLEGTFGVTRGFKNQMFVSKQHATATRTLTPLLAALRKHGPGPGFFYAHLMDAHEPYDRGTKKKGGAWSRYLSEVDLLDREIEKVTRLLKKRFPGRAYLMISADHGEAFGEHDTTFHSKTLYNELIHVPLLIQGPTIAAGPISERVGMIDLGPTIAELFGLKTPPGAMGVSLLPLAEGRRTEFQRELPLAAEGRMKRVLFLDDGLKVIEDDRHKTAELYDLKKDPKELRNLFDLEPELARRAQLTLRKFFRESELHRPGYSPPYKR